MPMEKPAALGEVIGGYRIEQVLGQGGMGCVYSATHTRLGRKSALKILSPQLAQSKECVSRFLREARIVNDVRHPNIVDIFDFIELEAPRRVAYVMEYIQGPSLGQVLASQRLTVRQAINVTRQILAALASAHAVGVVHRDLKPDNILVIGSMESELSAVPSVKVLDFGIAATERETSPRDRAVMLGTPAYMAPEQIALHPVSPATDVYAVGELFYEMISGERLFAGDRLRMLTSKLLGEERALRFPAPAEALATLAHLVRWMTALDPSERPTVFELDDELRMLLTQLPPEFGAAPSCGPLEVFLENSTGRKKAAAQVRSAETRRATRR